MANRIINGKNCQNKILTPKHTQKHGRIALAVR